VILEAISFIKGIMLLDECSSELFERSLLNVLDSVARTVDINNFGALICWLS
jgi:hypothetical protein